MWLLSIYKDEETQQYSHTEKKTWLRSSQRAAICSPRTEGSEETNFAATLIRMPSLTGRKLISAL